MLNLIAFGGPGFPAIGQVVVLMSILLAALWILNFFYDFLKNKPWKKKILQPPALPTDSPQHKNIP